MYDLSSFQRDVLYIIAGLDQAYGLAIKEELEQYYESEVNHGRLYPNLDELVDNGFIEKGEIDGRTNQYILTERGHREIVARRKWESQHVDVLRNAPTQK